MSDLKKVLWCLIIKCCRKAQGWLDDFLQIWLGIHHSEPSPLGASHNFCLHFVFWVVFVFRVVFLIPIIFVRGFVFVFLNLLVLVCVLVFAFVFEIEYVYLIFNCDCISIENITYLQSSWRTSSPSFWRSTKLEILPRTLTDASSLLFSCICIFRYVYAGLPEDSHWCFFYSPSYVCICTYLYLSKAVRNFSENIHFGRVWSPQWCHPAPGPPWPPPPQTESKTCHKCGCLPACLRHHHHHQVQTENRTYHIRESCKKEPF